MNGLKQEEATIVGSYGRKFTLKRIGEVGVKVPRDRKGEYTTRVIPRSIQYENAIRKDLCVMFLGGVSTRTLSLMSERLIGRGLSPTEISEASKELTSAVEKWRERDLSTETYKYIFVDGTHWAAHPLADHETVLKFIRTTKTASRLKIQATLHTKQYKKGIRISDDQMKEVNLKHYTQQPNWNYSVSPVNNVN